MLNTQNMWYASKNFKPVIVIALPPELLPSVIDFCCCSPSSCPCNFSKPIQKSYWVATAELLCLRDRRNKKIVARQSLVRGLTSYGTQKVKRHGCTRNFVFTVNPSVSYVSKSCRCKWVVILKIRSKTSRSMKAIRLGTLFTKLHRCIHKFIHKLL